MSFFVQCIDCGHTTAYHSNEINYPNCKSQWREAIYPYDQIAPAFPQNTAKRRFDLWRYGEVLPIHKPMPMLILGEGGTPLILPLDKP